MCTPVWDLLWPVASVVCPISGLGGHHLYIQFKFIIESYEHSTLNFTSSLIFVEMKHKFKLSKTTAHDFQIFPKTLTCSTDVTTGMRCPCNAIDTGTMIVQTSNWCAWYSDIQNNYL